MSHDDTTRLDRWIGAARSRAAKKAYTLASLVFALAAGGYALRPNPRYLPDSVTTGILVAGAVFYTGLRAWAAGAHREIPRIASSLLSVGRGVTNRLSAVDRKQVIASTAAIMLVLSSLGGLAGPLTSSGTASAAASEDLAIVGYGNGNVAAYYENGTKKWETSADSNSIQDVGVSESYAYSVSGGGGVYVYDISDGSQVASISGSNVVAAASGYFYHGTGNSEIKVRHISNQTAVGTYALPQGGNPRDAKSGPNGRVYVGTNQELHEIDENGYVNTLYTGNYRYWASLKITDSYLYAADNNNNTVYRLDKALDSATDVGPSGGSTAALADSKTWTSASTGNPGSEITSSAGDTFSFGSVNQNDLTSYGGSLYYSTNDGLKKVSPTDGSVSWTTSGDAEDTQLYRTGDFGVEVSGSATDGDGNGVDSGTVELRQSGSVVQSTTIASDGAYTFGSVSDGDYTVRVSADGYQNSSKSITVAGSPRTVDLSLAKEGTYLQPVVLDDDTGKFTDDPRLQVWKYTGDRTTPLGGPFTLPSNWRQVSQSSFNWQNLTTPRLKDGKLYSFTVTDGADVIAGVPPSPLYEYVGYRANSSADTLYLRIRDQSESNETVAADTDDGVAVTHETNGTDLTNLTYEIPGGPNTDGPAFEGGVPDFGDPGGDYQSVIGDDILGNISDRTDSGTVDEIEYEGGYSSGETFNGTTGVLDSFPGFTSNSSEGGAFGPVSGGGGGGTTTGQTIAGIGILAAGGYLAYRRWGNGNINVPVIGK